MLLIFINPDKGHYNTNIFVVIKKENKWIVIFFLIEKKKYGSDADIQLLSCQWPDGRPDIS